MATTCCSSFYAYFCSCHPRVVKWRFSMLFFLHSIKEGFRTWSSRHREYFSRKAWKFKRVEVGASGPLGRPQCSPTHQPWGLKRFVKNPLRPDRLFLDGSCTSWGFCLNLGFVCISEMLQLKCSFPFFFGSGRGNLEGFWKNVWFKFGTRLMVLRSYYTNFI